MSFTVHLKTRASTLETIEAEEAQANIAISELIGNITVLAARKDPLLKPVRSPKLLIRGLTDLKSMIEMVDIKHSIVRQIKFLLTNQARKQVLDASNFEGHMLHSVISGNPGTGKTTVGMILAKIWMGLGFINKAKPPTPPPVLIPQIPTVNETRLAELEESQRNHLRRLEHMKEDLTRCYTLAGEIRRQIIRLKPNPEKAKQVADTESEWNSLTAHCRDLRFGFDELMREVNIEPAGQTGVPEITGVTGLTGVTGQTDVDPYENIDPIFVVAAREDLIGEYLGHTAPKTKKILESARGGVLFIDEAYSLCNMESGSRDKFGDECLTTINEFMSLHPDEIIVIFSGYKDKLMNTIFKAQPGLLRRCAHFFEIKDYTPYGLAKIFKRQLAKNSWSVVPEIDLAKLFAKQTKLIRDGGGFTEKLALFAKLIYGQSKFNETINKENSEMVPHDSVITERMLLEAIEMLQNTSAMEIDDKPPSTMYT